MLVHDIYYKRLAVTYTRNVQITSNNNHRRINHNCIESKSARRLKFIELYKIFISTDSY